MPPPPTEPPSVCPKCGGPLDPTLPGGGCGACLLGGLIVDEQAERASGGALPSIPGYEIMEEIGHGGMGVVYRARQESSGRVVALKMVAPDTLRVLEARQRFLMEVEAMAAVEHPALIPLYDAGEDACGRPWLAMQYAAGGTLAARLAGYSRQWRRSAELLVVLARAVAYAHERGVLHRDLKPANILFDAADHPCIADFGLAKWADEDGGVTRSGHLLGSPAYLAPEAAAGGSKATTTVSDVYGLGAIFYELLCGARPYDGASAPEIITRIRDHAPVPPRAKLRDIPRDLEVIVQKAMAREPGQRYASAAALADDLDRWLEGRPILARPLGPLGRLVNWSRRKPALASLSALLAVSLLTGGVLLWRANRRLQISLDDANSRVDFMTRELPLHLRPLGRLDLLDSVFENVAQHYREARATDAAGLAREADFLTGWAQILRPRGQVSAAVERLTRAMEKARTATTLQPDLPAAVRSRLSAGRRLGEALIEAKRFDEARAALDETSTYAAAHRSTDTAQRVLEAELTMERCFLEWHQDRRREAIPHAENALRQWQELLPKLEKPPATPAHQAALGTLLGAWHSLASLQEEAGEAAASERSQQTFDELTARLRHAYPDNTDFHWRYLQNRLRRGWPFTGSDAQDHALLMEAESEAAALTARDPSNLQWMTSAANTAAALAYIARRDQHREEQLAWRKTLAARLDTIYRSYCTDLEYLRQLHLLGLQCAEQHENDDWPAARRHYEALVTTQRRILKLTNDPEETARLQRILDRVSERIEKNEGRPAAEQWLKETSAGR